MLIESCPLLKRRLIKGETQWYCKRSKRLDTKEIHDNLCCISIYEHELKIDVFVLNASHFNTDILAAQFRFVL